jgi:hypothetical protein
MDVFMEDKENDFISVHFESMTDLLEYEYPHNNNHNRRYFNYYLSDEYRCSDKKWFGPTVNNGNEAKKFALLGDHELYEKHLKEKVTELKKATGRFDKNQTQKIKSVKRKRIHSDRGDELDIHKVWQGQLDSAWSTTVREEFDKETKYITLFIMINGNGIINAVESLWRAAVTILLCDDLQRAGKNVQILVGGPSQNVTSDKYRSMCVSMVVKRYNEKLSVERLSACSHIGYYRSFCFAAKHAQPYTVRDSLGASCHMSPSYIPLQLREKIQAGSMRMFTVPAITSREQAINAINNITDDFNGAKNGSV